MMILRRVANNISADKVLSIADKKMILKRVANNISGDKVLSIGDKVLITGASIIGLTILKNDMDQNNKLAHRRKPDIIIKSGIFDKTIKSIDYSTFRFPFQRTFALSPTFTPIIHDINVGNCKKRISYSIKISDTHDVETLLKKLNINSFDDINKLQKFGNHVEEIVQSELDAVQFDYKLYETDTKYKNELIQNINTALSFYGCFIIDLVIGV